MSAKFSESDRNGIGLSSATIGQSTVRRDVALWTRVTFPVLSGSGGCPEV
jgi:hypothetical protein